MSDSSNARGIDTRYGDDQRSGLSELADLILAVGRLIRPPAELMPPMCTPVESSIMRFIDRHPGSSAREAAEATLLPSSNFTRVLRNLEEKGLVRREADARDKRGIRLYPTPLSQKNRRQLEDAWEQALAGAVKDPATLNTINTALRRVEEHLAARARGG